jgi:hypothetical protein
MSATRVTTDNLIRALIHLPAVKRLFMLGYKKLLIKKQFSESIWFQSYWWVRFGLAFLDGGVNMTLNGGRQLS